MDQLTSDEVVGQENGQLSDIDVPRDVEAEASRISNMIDSVALIGKDASGGVTRLAYTPEERQAHELVAGWFEELGCEVVRDGAGNTLVRKSGRDRSLPAIAVGSHLDSVPHGGRFDGVAGVVAVVEVMRMLQESGRATDHALLGVVFAAEEGARFREPSLGSKFATGSLVEDDLKRLRDSDGITLADAMKSVDLAPETALASKWSDKDIALFLELHVEQGAVLDAGGYQIGVADSISGSTRLRITVRGRANHSGATPMSLRADALMGGAEIALALENLSTLPSYRGLRATAGTLNVLPNTPTTIPGEMTMIIDIRDTDNDRQRMAAIDLIGRAKWICDRRGLTVESEVIADNSPIVLPMWVREQIRTVCEKRNLSQRFLSSGASHDAQVVSRLAPAGLIFVPSRDGLSHVAEEWTSPTEIARGTEVLFSSVLRMDQLLTSFRRRR